MTDRKSTPDAAQTGPARRALEVKADGSAPQHPAASPTPGEGMAPSPNPNIAPSGAFDAEGQRPVLERSRKAR